MELSSKAKENGPQYARLTAENPNGGGGERTQTRHCIDSHFGVSSRR
jgi:hypothetical protein